MPRARQRFAAPRRRTGWEEGPGQNTFVNINASSVAILGAGQQAGEDGNTIIRLRGFVELNLTQAVTIGDGFAGALGIGIVSAAAFAVGVTAVPTPITEVEWEGWLWHQYFNLHSAVATAAMTGSAGILRLMIDSKAMRKIDTEETIYAALEVTETGGGNMIVRLGTRMLIKLA